MYSYPREPRNLGIFYLPCHVPVHTRIRRGLGLWAVRDNLAKPSSVHIIYVCMSTTPCTERCTSDFLCTPNLSDQHHGPDFLHLLFNPLAAAITGRQPTTVSHDSQVCLTLPSISPVPTRHSVRCFLVFRSPNFSICT